MISIKNVSNVLQAWEYVKINVTPDTISLPSDSVTSIKPFNKYYFNEVYDATK